MRCTYSLVCRCRSYSLLQEKAVMFVTNNATKSRKNYKKKFDSLGVEAHVDEIYGSAFAAAVYISSVMKMPKDKKVYVIGMDGLEEELRDEGIAYLGGTVSAISSPLPEVLHTWVNRTLRTTRSPASRSRSGRLTRAWARSSAGSTRPSTTRSSPKRSTICSGTRAARSS